VSRRRRPTIPAGWTVPKDVLAALFALSCSIWIVNLPRAPARVRRGFAAPPATHRNIPLRCLAR
jgi:hypothetical protein